MAQDPKDMRTRIITATAAATATSPTPAATSPATAPNTPSISRFPPDITAPPRPSSTPIPSQTPIRKRQQQQPLPQPTQSTLCLACSSIFDGATPRNEEGEVLHHTLETLATTAAQGCHLCLTVYASLDPDLFEKSQSQGSNERQSESSGHHQHQPLLQQHRQQRQQQSHHHRYAHGFACVTPIAKDQARLGFRYETVDVVGAGGSSDGRNSSNSNCNSTSTSTSSSRSERVHDHHHHHGKDKTAVRGNDSTAPVTVELILMNPRYAVEPGVRTISTGATSTASEESLMIARAWLDECAYNHMKCSASTNMGIGPGLGAEVAWKPTHLLDVSIRGPGGAQGVRLVDGSSVDPQSEYVTLSHVWGRQKGVRLHKGTLAALRHGVAASSLPRTFAEAAMVTVTLGFRYLWIDALCIMHDSEQEALREISMMDRIYGGGVLNLAATGAKDDTCGLIAERNVMALQPCVVSVTGLGMGIEEGLYKCLRSTVWQDLINSSPLVKRAWVFQERALARRTLHFTRNELLWECQQMCSSEVFPKGLPATMKGGVRDKDTFDKRVHHQRHGNWASLVKQYSRGRLSYSSDKLLALGGLARQYMHRNNKLSSSDYVCGMWRSMLPQALLWTVDNGVRPKKWRAPSWAWTSIDGEVTLPDVRQQPEVGRDVCLQVIQALVTTKADDPFGQVESARLQVRGFMARGLLRRTHDYWGQGRCMIDFGSSSSSNSSGGNIGVGGRLELDAACFDERLPKLTAMGSHHGLAEQVEVYLLPVVDSIDRVDGLILCSNLKRGEFRRLGSFQVSRHGSWAQFKALTKHDPRLVNLDGRIDHAPGVADDTGTGSGIGSGGERCASDFTYLVTLV